MLAYFYTLYSLLCIIARQFVKYESFLIITKMFPGKNLKVRIIMSFLPRTFGHPKNSSTLQQACFYIPSPISFKSNKFSLSNHDIRAKQEAIHPRATSDSRKNSLTDSVHIWSIRANILASTVVSSRSEKLRECKSDGYARYGHTYATVYQGKQTAPNLSWGWFIDLKVQSFKEEEQKRGRETGSRLDKYFINVKAFVIDRNFKVSTHRWGSRSNVFSQYSTKY